MKVLPVLDLRHGVCVRAVAGNRDAYQPVNMRGLASPTPAHVGCWYRDQFGLSELYVADLSAIMGEGPAWGSYAELENAGFDWWLDAGIGSRTDWQRQVAARDIHGPNPPWPDGFSVVGKPQRKVDGLAKATGEAVYTDDIVLPGMLHGKTLRSPRQLAPLPVLATTSPSMIHPSNAMWAIFSLVGGTTSM